MGLAKWIFFLFISIVYADVTTNLIGHWKLDETSGTTAVDTVGSNNGTYVNLVTSPWQTGKIDGSLSLANINASRVDVSDIHSFTGTANFTLALWVYRTSTSGSTFQTVLSKMNDPGTGRDGWTLGVCNGCGTANRGFACERYNAGANQAAVETTGDIPLNQWVHVTCTYDGSRIRVYRDGVIAQTSSTSALSVPSNTGTLRIGNTYANNLAFRGYLDEVRIYDRALSAAEAYTLANPCTSSEEKILKYFTADSRLRYCNSKYWESTTSRSAGSACTKAGRFDFETVGNTMQFCNGSNYYPMGPSSAGGSGCSSPTGAKGKLKYNTTTKYYQYCDGSAWVNVGT